MKQDQTRIIRKFQEDFLNTFGNIELKQAFLYAPSTRLHSLVD
jgi:hypothetical protein